MKVLQRILPLLTASLAISAASAQTWISELPEFVTRQPSVAVSDIGNIALVKPEGVSRNAVSVLDEDGALLHQFGIAPPIPGIPFQLEDSMFLDNDTLVVCGSVDGEPYAGAFDVATGIAVWEKSLRADGCMKGMTRNSQGHIIAHGTVTENGANETLLCSMNPTSGGFQWFRSYNPGTGDVFSQDIVAVPTGDMYFVLQLEDDVMVMRLSNYGHEVWSEMYSIAGTDFTKARACMAQDGGLLIAALGTKGADEVNLAFRIDPTGSPLWTREFQIPNIQGLRADLGNVLPTANGGMRMGVFMMDTIAPTRTSPGVIQVSASGTTEWAKNYGTSARGYLPDLAETPDGGFVAFFKHGFFSTRVLRADSLGTVGPCTGFSEAIVTTPRGMIAQSTTYTYEAFPGGIGTVQTGFNLELTTIENVCRRDGGVGVPFCDPANPNSTGQSTKVTGVIGTGIASNLRLEASQGPANQFGYFLVGTHQNTLGVSIGQGRLCLGTAVEQQIGRYNVNGTAMNSVGRFDSAGVYQNLVGTSTTGQGFDVPAQLPAIGGSIQTGQTYHFQLWHRDIAGESNFSNGLRVTF